MRGGSRILPVDLPIAPLPSLDAGLYTLRGWRA
jgi:hypothetical protein